MNLKKTLGIAALLLPCFVAVVDAQTRRTSGDSGSVAGIIIGAIAGAIILFLVCRELICWYYKINRLVVLMEQQNSLLSSLKQLLEGASPNQTSEGKSNSIPVAGFTPTHRVKLSTNNVGLYLRKNPNIISDLLMTIPNGAEIQLLETGEDAKITGIKAPWFKVMAKSGEIGWCFSGDLEML